MIRTQEYKLNVHAQSVDIYTCWSAWGLGRSLDT
jgi:hypothetical protein